jgi:hypothetical protein
MASINSQFKQFLVDLDNTEAIEIVGEIELGVNPPPLLSDVNVGQSLHLAAIYVALVLTYIYTAGYIVGYNFKLLMGATYNMGYTLGRSIHQLNDTLTGLLAQPFNHSTTGGAYELQHTLSQLQSFFIP